MIANYLLFQFLFFFFYLPVLPNQKKAYSAHYQGSLLYAEGEWGKANQKFQQAHSIVPNNFYFGLSYGLSEGRLGKAKRGVSLIQNAMTYLDPLDPDFRYKYASAIFLKAMVHAYSQDYGAAYQQMQQSKNIAPDTLPLQSLIEHNMGFLSIANQTINRNRRDRLAAHYHVRKHDLEKGLSHFESALKTNPGNNNTLHNYQVLCDTLGLPNRYKDQAPSDKIKTKIEPTFIDMHQKIIEDLRLDQYAELAFLVDVSGSMVSQNVLCMNDTRFNVMKDLGRKVVDALPEETALGLGTIGGDCPDDPAQWDMVGQLDKKALRTKLRFLIPDGTTPLLTMLKKAPTLFSDSSKAKRSIFLVSDGANTCREPGLDICFFAEELAKKDIAVNVLTFLSSSYNNTGAFSEYLCLAEKTGGQIIYMDNYRCFFQTLSFDLLETCYLKLPNLVQSTCWGGSNRDLWMFFQDQG